MKLATFAGPAHTTLGRIVNCGQFNYASDGHRAARVPSEDPCNILPGDGYPIKALEALWIRPRPVLINLNVKAVIALCKAEEAAHKEVQRQLREEAKRLPKADDRKREMARIKGLAPTLQIKTAGITGTKYEEAVWHYPTTTPAVGINARYLREALMGAKWATMHIEDEYSPVEIKRPDSEHLIMPIRL
jgi:hypothetical protein